MPKPYLHVMDHDKQPTLDRVLVSMFYCAAETFPALLHAPC